MDDTKSTGSFFSELRRRKVIRTCLLYILVCWGGLQVLDIVAPALGYDADLLSRYFLYIAVLGFPVNFALAWFYQISTSGIVRTQSFVERRVLDNIAPVTDKRRHGVSTFLRKGEEGNQVHWVVSAETGPLSGLSYAIQEPILLGRALECDLAVVSPPISRQHAKLEVIDGHLHIEDLGSSNGTMINGKRASGQHQLRHDDELRFHDIIFRVTENLSRPHSERQASDQTTFIQAAELEKHN
jgi:hypothetical protein